MNFEFRKPKGAERAPTKVCLKCRAEKDVLTDFYWANGVGIGWPGGRCKSCMAEAQIAYRSTRKAKYAEYAKNQRLRNPEKFKEIERKANLKDGGKRKARYLESLKDRKGEPMECVSCKSTKDSKEDYYNFSQPCRKCCNARGKAARLANPEATKQKRRAEYQADKPAAKARAKQWRLANPERVRELNRAKAKTAEGKLATRHHNWQRRSYQYKARVDGSPCVSAKWFEELKAKHDHRCYYCWDSSQPLTMDHIVPLAGGGKHVRENILPSCKSCNSRKSDSLISEWRPWIDIPIYGLELATG